MDWVGWHGDYDRPDSSLARRLQTVQAQIRDVLHAAAPGPLRVVSLCAGQGHDLLGVLAGHPRRDDVQARLVELDPRNAAAAGEKVRAAGLHGVEVVAADAALTDRYQGMVPADLVLLCGIFGNVLDADIERTIGFCPQLCASGATVIWTRARGVPDRVPMICDRFERLGFQRRWLSAPDAGFGVGVHRFAGQPQPLATGERMFTFTGYDKLRQRDSPPRNS